MRRFFFLHYPTRRKTGDGKHIYRTNADDRREMIETMGEDGFEESPVYGELRDYDPPPFFLPLYRLFIEVYREEWAWGEVESYCRLQGLRLSLYEIGVLSRMRRWAASQVSEMRKE